jgi:hypothetical protein
MFLTTHPAFAVFGFDALPIRAGIFVMVNFTVLRRVLG